MGVPFLTFFLFLFNIKWRSFKNFARIWRRKPRSCNVSSLRVRNEFGTVRAGGYLLWRIRKVIHQHKCIKNKMLHMCHLWFKNCHRCEQSTTNDTTEFRRAPKYFQTFKVLPLWSSRNWIGANSSFVNRLDVLQPLAVSSLLSTRDLGMYSNRRPTFVGKKLKLLCLKNFDERYSFRLILIRSDCLRLQVVFLSNRQRNRPAKRQNNNLWWSAPSAVMTNLIKKTSLPAVMGTAFVSAAFVGKSRGDRSHWIEFRVHFYRHCEELFSVPSIHITCPSVSCTAEYSLTDLKVMRLPQKMFSIFTTFAYRLQLALESPMYNILIKRRQDEEVLKAGIPGHCHEVNHAPLRCTESSMETRSRTYVEEKMTQALLRTCPNCQKSFTKVEGCNKIVWPNAFIQHDSQYTRDDFFNRLAFVVPYCATYAVNPSEAMITSEQVSAPSGAIYVDSMNER